MVTYLSDFLKLSLWRQLLVALSYVLLTQLSLRYSPTGFVTILWPASGLALAVLVRMGPQYSLGLFIGALSTYSISGKSWPAVFAIAIGNGLEAYIGAWFLTHRFQRPYRCDSLHNYLRLVGLAGFVASALSASIGTSTLYWTHSIPAVHFINACIHWWMGDILGIMLIAPLLLVWSAPGLPRYTKNQGIELLAACSCSIVIGQIVFLDLLHTQFGLVANTYWLFLTVTWIAVRFGVHSTTVIILLVGAQALQGAYTQSGYFAQDMRLSELVNYWLYMVILAIVGMVLATHFGELKAAKQALEASERAARKTLNELINQKFALDQHAIIAETDIQGSITAVNDKFCSISGYSKAELMHQNHRILKSSQHSKEYFRDMYRTIAHGGVWQGEICNRAKDGHLYWVDSTIMPIVFENGKPEKYIAIRTDITKRKQVELALREHQQILQAAQQIARIGYYRVDIADAHWESSPILDEIFGINEQFEKTISNWFGLIHIDNRERIFAAYHQAITAKQPFAEVYNILRHCDQQERWISSLGACEYDSHGNPVRFINTVQDITEQRMAKMELERHRDHLQELIHEKTHELISAKNSAEQANKAKSIFLTNMSHELRTPLHSILAFSKLGLDKSRLNPCDVEKLAFYYQRIIESADRLLLLINDLLDLSKLETGKVQIELLPCHFSQLVMQVLDEVSATARAKNIQLDSTGLIMNLHLSCDSKMIAQVIRTLLLITIKFSNENSRIMISTKLASLRGTENPVSAHDTVLEFSIQDQSSNIAIIELDTIFDHFMAHSNRSSANASSTGLGLAICREIIQAHRGTIQAYNNTGAGNCFNFTLPCQQFSQSI